LRTLARRVLELDTEVAALDNVLKPLVAATAPELLAQVGVGTDTAGALLSPPAKTPAVSATNAPSPGSAAPPPSTRHPASNNDTGSAAPATPSQLGALADRDQQALPRPRHTALPPAPPRPRQDQSRSHPLPQALRRPRALPPAPTTTTDLTTPRSINRWHLGA
jgi:hypothetical protein